MGLWTVNYFFREYGYICQNYDINTIKMSNFASEVYTTERLMLMLRGKDVDEQHLKNGSKLSAIFMGVLK